MVLQIAKIYCNIGMHKPHGTMKILNNKRIQQQKEKKRSTLKMATIHCKLGTHKPHGTQKIFNTKKIQQQKGERKINTKNGCNVL